MSSKLGETLRAFIRRNRQQTRATVGDVLVENPIAAANLKVEPVLKGAEGDPGYYSQPVAYNIVASYKGAVRMCQIPASHEGVPYINVCENGCTRSKPVREKGLRLTGVRLVEVPSDDPLVDPKSCVTLRLIFTQRRTGRTSTYDFYLN